MAQNVKINGVTYSSVPEVDIPSPLAAEPRSSTTPQGQPQPPPTSSMGKTAFGASGSVSGSMPNNGSTSGTISTKSGTVTIPAGYTSGGTVSIASAAVTDLTAANLLSGKTVLGVAGTLSLPSISQDSTTKVLTIS